MLKRENRIRFGTQIKSASVFHAPLFTLRASQNGQSNSRFGFVISKKIDKRAVVRNRVKRLIGGCIEKNIDQIKSGYDMIFYLKKEAVWKTQEEQCRILMELLKKGEFLKTT